MKYMLLLLLAPVASAAPLVQPQDLAPSTFTVGGLYVTNGVTASSGTFTGAGGVSITGAALNMNSHLVSNVTDPVSAQDAATKNYVDTNANNFDFKAPARLATTAALPSNSYNNANGTITGLSIGLLTIDGATAQTGDRILVKNEGTASHNGIYTVTTNTTLVVFVLTRATDFNTVAEMADGVAVLIDSGTANEGTGWVTISSVTTIGTDPVTFVQFAGPGIITGNAAISVTNTAGNIALAAVSSSVTLQGNAFNGASQLVLLDANSAAQLAGSITATTGTLTGTGFAVGGSSFVVAGGSTTVAYRLKAGNAAFGTGATVSTFTAAGALSLASGAALTLSGSAGTIVTGSSVTAGLFTGDGSGLSNIGGVLAGGTNGYGARWTGSTTLGLSAAFDNGTAITIPAASSFTVAGGSTITINSGATFFVNPNAITNNWIFISSSDTTGTNSVTNATQTFTLTNYITDTTSAAWRAEWNCNLSSATFLYLLFNGDTGAHYGYTSNYISIAAAAFADGGTVEHGCDMNAGVVTSATPSMEEGWVEFQTAIGLTKNIIFNGHNQFNRASLQAPVNFSGLYTGTTTPTQLNLTQGAAVSSTAPNHAGFLNCHMDLYRRGFQHQ